MTSFVFYNVSLRAPIDERLYGATIESAKPFIRSNILWRYRKVNIFVTLFFVAPKEYEGVGVSNCDVKK